MADTTTATAPEGTEAPSGEAAPEATTQEAAPQTPDELASLRSRNSGLNAKVTTLQQERDQLRAELDNARKGLTDKDAGDADLRAQLAAAQTALETAKKEATLASLRGSYPEAFAELGEGALALTPEKLASLEARLTSAKDSGSEEPETPRPVGNSQQRQTGPKSIEDMTSAELQAYMKTLDPSVMGL